MEDQVVEVVVVVDRVEVDQVEVDQVVVGQVIVHLRILHLIHLPIPPLVTVFRIIPLTHLLIHHLALPIFPHLHIHRQVIAIPEADQELDLKM